MRLNVNHTDRFVWACHPENLATYKDQIEKLAGVRLAGPYFSETQGAHICTSNAGGLQLMAPAAPVPSLISMALHETLSTQGEGPFAVVFGVPDLAAARARLERLGYPSGETIRPDGDEPWAGEINAMAQSFVCKLMGAHFIIAEIEYPDHVLSLDGGAVGQTRNNDRLDHVAWLSQPENYHDNIRRLSELGGTPLDGPFDITPLGIRAALSWETGLEVISPIPGSDGPAARDCARLLSLRGETFYAVLFGVADMAAARDRACAEGYTPGRLIEGGDPRTPWAGKFLSFQELPIGELVHTPFMFCAVEYPEGIFVTRR